MEKRFETYFDKNPPTCSYTKKDFRQNNVLVYSTGNKNEWYVRLWLGERKSHGICVSEIFKTKKEAEKQADIISDYLSEVFIVKSIKNRKVRT